MQNVITYVVRSHFDAAHYLPEYAGKCRNIHGHTYKVTLRVTYVLVDDGLPECGYIVDFKDLRHALSEILQRLDHELLNNCIEQVPTVENIALHILREIWAMLKPVPQHVTVEVEETPGCAVVVE